ncbi:MAG: 6-carboxytetrahydropterin synthase QueD [Thermoleophilia bacterium]|nr:6-carboxytetrahydropterin synthase QueD [Actinomycetota bacterium]
MTKILSFDAAHSLPDHPGKCRNVHGHTYSVEVTVEGPVREAGPSRAMVMDFGELEERVAALVVEPLDHRYLNDVVDLVPTAEALAAWMFARLRDSGLPVVRVRLWETPTSYAEVTA